MVGGRKPEGLAPRLYVDAPLAAGAPIALDSARGHYLRNVLRREKGASVPLFNGPDGEWLAEIGKLAKSGALLSLPGQTVTQPPGPELCLRFAPLKRSGTGL